MSLPGALANLGAYSFQIALLALSGALVARSMRLRAPRVMLGYWQGLLAVCLLLPALQPWRSKATITRGLSWVVTAGPTEDAGPGVDAVTLVAGLLAAGTILRLAWLGLGLRRLALLRRRARPIDPAPAVPADLAARLGVRAHFYLSAEVDAPATFGHRRATVLLPETFLALSPAAQRSVAAHELLHVRRRDWAATVAEELVRAALWFHPAVHWLLGRIRLCREQVVDREAAALGDRRAYLDALLEVARGLVRARPLPASLMLGEGHLKARIELLLEEVDMSKRKIAISLSTSVAALAVAAAAAVWSFPLVEAKPKPAAERTIVTKVNPTYPAEAKKDKIEGIVLLEVKVEKSGEVSSVKPVKGPEVLRDAAASAVRQWRYEPSDDGPTLMTITVRFLLAKDKDKDKEKE
jgi:D-alanyl-D-alanine endopeptidase (penicillin-binding protein 7)